MFFFSVTVFVTRDPGGQSPAASPVDITWFPTDQPEQEEGREKMSSGEALGRSY